MSGRFAIRLLLLALLASSLHPGTGLPLITSRDRSARAAEVTAFDLILAMNSLRASYGKGLLIEDPIVMAVAQATAEYMAANQMSSHIGNVDGRIPPPATAEAEKSGPRKISPWVITTLSTRSWWCGQMKPTCSRRPIRATATWVLASPNPPTA